MTPEFSRIVESETISDAPRIVDIAANEAELKKLAGRFSLPSLDRLSAKITLSRRSGIVHADGRIEAAVVQACVVTGDPLPAEVIAPFSIRFVPDAYATPGEEEWELSAGDCDTLPLEREIDLGELVAETLALSLDPFPRSAGADAAMQETGMGGEAEMGAFAGLKALKDKLEKGN